MRRGSRLRLLGLALVAGLIFVLVGSFVVPFLQIAWNLHVGEAAKNELLDALQERYPEVKFQGGYSYERPRVYLRALGVTDEVKRREIADWLAEQKVARKLNVQILLRFDEESTWSDPDTFQF